MRSSASSNPSIPSTRTASCFPRRHLAPSSFAFPDSFPLGFSRRPAKCRFSVSLVAPNHRNLGWDSSSDSDGFGGWLTSSDTPQPRLEKKKGLRKIVIGGVGSSLAVLLGAIAYLSFSRRASKFQFESPFQSIRGILSGTVNNKTEALDPHVTDERELGSEISFEHFDDAEEAPASIEKSERVTVSVAADTTQQEALEVLKKLKIIEEDVRADELCTRREYARWLVRANASLEGNPKHRVVPSLALAGSSTPAFDDVSVEDPDFEYIQALAEAGIISSNLSISNELSRQGSVTFSHESFVSRKDLINWKVQMEYGLNPEIMEEISRTKVDFMDAKEINHDVAPELFMDMLAGEKSILRKVFGRIKRFQPNKPATKAQAAVALTSGRMVEAVRTRLSRIESENLARQAEMKMIRSELLEGELKQFWDMKLEEERTRLYELENQYLAIVSELEEEKIAQEKWFADHVKEKSTIDCQKQLLFSLRDEVEEMSEKISFEKSINLTERSELDHMLGDVRLELETLLDKKSILEAEVEALRILRSWIEDEARRSQARAKVLEEVGRRWKWEDQS